MKQALLAVSFGTTVEEARAMDLAGVEAALCRAAPRLSFARAYTSPTVRRILARRGERVPGLEEALEAQAAAEHGGAVCPSHPCASRRGV